MTKRVLSLLLVLVMVLSLSVPALAAEGEETAVAAVEQTETNPVAAAADEPAEAYVVKPLEGGSLGDAIELAEKTGETVQLVYSITDPHQVTVNADVTLDLNGYKLEVPMTVAKGNLTVIDSNAYNKSNLVAITVGPKGELTVKSGLVTTVTNNGVLNVEGGKVVNTAGGDVNVSGGELGGWDPTKGGTLTVSGGKVSSGVYFNKLEDDAEMIVSGGSVVGEISLKDELGTVTITGGTVKGTIHVNAGYLNVSGGKIVAACSHGKTEALRMDAKHRADVSVEISGGTFVAAEDGKCAIYVNPDTKTTDHYITGGRFVPSVGGETMVTDNATNTECLKEIAKSATVAHIWDTDDPDYVEYTLLGKSAIEAFGAATKKAYINVLQGSATFTDVDDDVQIKNSTKKDITVNGTTVKPGDHWGKWEAKIGEKKYEHFSDPTDPTHSAVDNVKTGQTITLLKDVIVSQTTLIADKNVTLDLNGHVLCLDADLHVANNNASVRTRTIKFTGEGDVIGSNSQNYHGNLVIDGSNVKIDLVDTYFHSPIVCPNSAVGNQLVVGKDAFLAGMVGAEGRRFNGSVTVIGRVLGNLWVDSVGSFEVNIQGTVDHDVYVCGDEGIFTMVPGAKIGGQLMLGSWEGRTGDPRDNAMDIQITGGEVLGSTHFFIERHSSAVISDGDFGGDSVNSFFATVDDPDGISPLEFLSVTGGAFAYEPYNAPHAYVVGKNPVARVVDADEDDPYEYSDWWLVGNARIITALANVPKGDLIVEQGTLTLASIPNDIMVTVKDGATLKVDDVTIGSTEDYDPIPGSSINTLNTLIDYAYTVSGSGKLSETDQRNLADALFDALATKHGWDEDADEYVAATFNPEVLVQDAVDQLQKLIDSWPDLDPDVPWVPEGYTDWFKNPTTGDWYFFVNGQKLTNKWVYSKHMIWYYVDDEGIMQTGVAYAKAALTYDCNTGIIGTKYEPAGWYYFETSADSDAPGRIRGGWHETAEYGSVWSIKEHKGYYGMITWTDAYKGPIPTPAQ